jgi:hypothetical protein
MGPDLVSMMWQATGFYFLKKCFTERTVETDCYDEKYTCLLKNLIFFNKCTATIFQKLKGEYSAGWFG